jgi:hypothetical protein
MTGAESPSSHPSRLDEATEPAFELHALTAELRRALDHPAETCIGTYARLVEEIMGELSLMQRHSGFMSQPALRPGYPRGEATRLPMSEEEEQRIVEYLVGRQETADKSKA